MSNQKARRPGGHPVIIDADVTPPASGIEVPRLGPRENVLLDDDEQVSRVISEEEPDESYVDGGIKTFRLGQLDVPHARALAGRVRSRRHGDLVDNPFEGVSVMIDVNPVARRLSIFVMGISATIGSAKEGIDAIDSGRGEDVR